MNLFLRLVRIFIAALFSKERVDMLAPTFLKFRVWLLDQDMFAHMTNSRYLSFGDLGTINYMIRSGFWPVLRKHGWFPVICSQNVVIHRMLRQPQKFTLKSQVVGWDDTYVCLRHSFMRDETQHAELRVVARFASRNRKRVDTDDVMKAMGNEHISPKIEPIFADMIAEVRAGREEIKKTNV